MKPIVTKEGQMILLFVGPSCAGKTTLLQRLIEKYPEKFASLKSIATRPRRRGEGGLEYDFVSMDEFDRCVEAGDICQQVEFPGGNYGTKRSDLKRILAEGKIPVRIVEPGGVYQFKKIGKELNFGVKTVFVTARIEVILKRWLTRMAEDENLKDNLDRYIKRLTSTVVDEMSWRNAYKWDIVLNDIEGVLEKDVDLLAGILKVREANS